MTTVGQRPTCAGAGVCMCQRCNCGTHKCPGSVNDKRESLRRKACEPPEEHPHFSGITTYNEDYNDKKQPPRYKHVTDGKTLDNCLGDAEEFGQPGSEYRDRYQRFNIRPRNGIMFPSSVGAFGPGLDDATTYNIDYRRWPTMKRTSILWEENLKGGGSFDDRTNYKVSYWDKSKEYHPLRRIEKPKRFESEPPSFRWRKSEDYDKQFDGETTYHERFKAWDSGLPRRGKAVSNALMKGPSCFNADTTYHEHFQKPPPLKHCTVVMKPPRNLVDNHFCF